VEIDPEFDGNEPRGWGYPVTGRNPGDAPEKAGTLLELFGGMDELARQEM
jgi:hypothetical protein